MAPATNTGLEQTPRRRVPAAQRRQELVQAAVNEFARGGLHGTAVAQIARRVGVAQPYVFALFPTKHELFLAAVAEGFHRTMDVFSEVARHFDPVAAGPGTDMLSAMGQAYFHLTEIEPEQLMLQHQAYAACGEESIRVRVRQLYAELVRHVAELSQAEPERLDEFFRYGMWFNVSAAMGVGATSPSEWVAGAPQASPGESRPAHSG